MNEPKKKINYFAIIISLLTLIVAFFSIPSIDRCFQKKDDAKSGSTIQVVHNGPNYINSSKQRDTSTSERDTLSTILPKPKPTKVPEQSVVPNPGLPKTSQPTPKVLDPIIRKIETRRLILDFIITQPAIGIKYKGHGEMDIKSDGSIWGAIDYKLNYVPYEYRNERSLRGNPTATEMVRGNLEANEYRFDGYELRNDYQNAYAVDKYVIKLNSSDNNFKGSSVGDSNGKCILEGTYYWQ